MWHGSHLQDARQIVVFHLQVSHFFLQLLDFFWDFIVQLLQDLLHFLLQLFDFVKSLAVFVVTVVEQKLHRAFSIF